MNHFDRALVLEKEDHKIHYILLGHDDGDGENEQYGSFDQKKKRSEDKATKRSHEEKMSPLMCIVVCNCQSRKRNRDREREKKSVKLFLSLFSTLFSSTRFNPCPTDVMCPSQD